MSFIGGEQIINKNKIDKSVNYRKINHWNTLAFHLKLISVP